MFKYPAVSVIRLVTELKVFKALVAHIRLFANIGIIVSRCNVYAMQGFRIISESLPPGVNFNQSSFWRNHFWIPWQNLEKFIFFIKLRVCISVCNLFLFAETFNMGKQFHDENSSEISLSFVVTFLLDSWVFVLYYNVVF